MMTHLIKKLEYTKIAIIENVRMDITSNKEENNVE